MRQLARRETFQHACRNVSQAGDVIQVPAGTYSAQAAPDGSKAVTFQGSLGNTIRKLQTTWPTSRLMGLNIDANFGTPSVASTEPLALPM